MLGSIYIVLVVYLLNVAVSNTLKSLIKVLLLAFKLENIGSTRSAHSSQRFWILKNFKARREIHEYNSCLNSFKEVPETHFYLINK